MERPIYGLYSNDDAPVCIGVNSISKIFKYFHFGFHLFSNSMLFLPLEFYENPITLQMPVKRSHIKRNQIPNSNNKRSNTVATLLISAMLNSKIHIFSFNSNISSCSHQFYQILNTFNRKQQFENCSIFEAMIFVLLLKIKSLFPIEKYYK